MDPPSSAVPDETLQRQAYLFWEAAGFPPGQSEHFWLMAEQHFKPTEPAPAPARKTPAVTKRKPPAAPPPAAEAAPVHPTRNKAATKAAAPKPAVKTPAKPAAKAPAKPAAKSPAKPAAPPPAKPATPAAKSPAKPRKPKAGDAS